MPGQVNPPAFRHGPLGPQNRLHVDGLPLTDLDDDVPSGGEEGSGSGSDPAIGFETVGTAIESCRRVKIPDFDGKRRQNRARYIGWIRQDQVEAARKPREPASFDE